MKLIHQALLILIILLFVAPSSPVSLSWSEQTEPYIRKSVIEKVVNRLWLLIDHRCIGAITFNQARHSTPKVLEVFNKQNEFTYGLFLKYFKQIDSSCERALSKSEFIDWIDMFLNGDCQSYFCDRD